MNMSSISNSSGCNNSLTATDMVRQQAAQAQAQAQYLTFQREQLRYQALQLAQCGEPAADTVKRAEAYLAFLQGSDSSRP